jgi:hypothetical protein
VTAIQSAVDAHLALDTDPKILLAFVRSLVAGLVAQLPSTEKHSVTLPSPAKTPQSAAAHPTTTTSHASRTAPTTDHTPSPPQARSVTTSNSLPAPAPPKTLHGPSKAKDFIRVASDRSGSSRPRASRNMRPAVPPTFGGLQPFLENANKPPPSKRVYVPSSLSGDEEEGSEPKRNKARSPSVEPIDSE